MYLPHPFAEALARPRQWGQGGGGGRASIGSASVWEEDGWSQQGMSKSKQTHSNSHAPSSRGSVVFVSVPFPIPPHRHRPLPSCTHAQPHAGDDLLPGSGPGSVHGSVSSRGGPSLFTGGPSVNTSVGYVRGTGLTPVHGNNLAAPPNRYPQSADLSQFDGWGFLEEDLAGDSWDGGGGLGQDPWSSASSVCSSLAGAPGDMLTLPIWGNPRGRPSAAGSVASVGFGGVQPEASARGWVVDVELRPVGSGGDSVVTVVTPVSSARRVVHGDVSSTPQVGPAYARLARGFTPIASVSSISNSSSSSSVRPVTMARLGGPGTEGGHPGLGVGAVSLMPQGACTAHRGHTCAALH